MGIRAISLCNITGHVINVTQTVSQKAKVTVLHELKGLLSHCSGGEQLENLSASLTMPSEKLQFNKHAKAAC